ncbi:MAG: RibD family protein, partial [Pseudomonadota bacterium]
RWRSIRDRKPALIARASAAINAGFLSRIERQRPWVVLKLATTIDGRIATRTGESRWITGPDARRYVHLMRAQSDAILVGAGTARVDDPMLDVRGLGLGARSPKRIVMDGALSLPLTSRLVKTAGEIPVMILHRDSADPARREALQGLGIETVVVPDKSGLPDPGAALSTLAKDHGVTRLMCEGGGKLAASLLSARLVDELVLFQAGKAIGGDGLPAVQGFGLEALDRAPHFSLSRVRALGADVVSHWQRSA